MRHIPNTITLLNLFFGSIGVVMSIEGKPHYAAILMGICAVLDYFDGFFARLLNQKSKLGIQLDSLADLVSFGLGSSAIMFHYLSLATENLPGGIAIGLLPYTAFILVVFAALRLARFNIDERQTDGFIGMPTPANAMFFASLPIVLFFGDYNVGYDLVQNFTESVPAMVIASFLFAGFMVLPLPMFSLKAKSIAWKSNEIRVAFLLVVFGLLFIGGVSALPLITPIYLLLSLLQFGLHLKSNRH